MKKMLMKIFGKRTKSIRKVKILSPLSGHIVELTRVPDPVFAGKMMGDGVAIEPIEGIVLSPVDGYIMQIFPTNHAIAIRAINEVEIFIHIGLETASLQGEGFETYVKPGDHVLAGEKLIEFDLNTIKGRAKSTVTPLIITNIDQGVVLEHMKDIRVVEKGVTPLMEVTYQ